MTTRRPYWGRRMRVGVGSESPVDYRAIASGSGAALQRFRLFQGPPMLAGAGLDVGVQTNTLLEGAAADAYAYLWLEARFGIDGAENRILCDLGSGVALPIRGQLTAVDLIATLNVPNNRAVLELSAAVMAHAQAPHDLIYS